MLQKEPEKRNIILLGNKDKLKINNYIKFSNNIVIVNNDRTLLKKFQKDFFKRGYKIHIINSNTIKEGRLKYNPIFYIRNCKDIDLLVEVLLENKFWNLKEDILLYLLIYYIWQTDKKSHFSEMYNMLLLSDLELESKLNKLPQNTENEEYHKKLIFYIDSPPEDKHNTKTSLKIKLMPYALWLSKDASKKFPLIRNFVKTKRVTFIEIAPETESVIADIQKLYALQLFNSLFDEYKNKPSQKKRKTTFCINSCLSLSSISYIETKLQLINDSKMNIIFM